jgi:diacylglycerol diphosphate phosphatase/phosphatidate phosphatase
MGLSYALSTAMLLLCLIKVLIGGLRPHFYTVCQPVNPPNVPGIANTAGIPKSPLKFYAASQVCQGPSHLVNEAQMSFPSGHACAAFAGFGFLALYLNAKYKTLSPGSHYKNYYRPSDPPPSSQAPEGRRPHHWKLVLSMAPWCIAILLALSKLRDQSHHPVDVVGGALLGTLFAHLAYRMVYRGVYNWRTNHIPLGGDGGDRDKGARKEM